MISQSLIILVVAVVLSILFSDSFETDQDLTTTGDLVTTGDLKTTGGTVIYGSSETLYTSNGDQNMNMDVAVTKLNRNDCTAHRYVYINDNGVEGQIKFIVRVNYNCGYYWYVTMNGPNERGGVTKSLLNEGDSMMIMYTASKWTLISWNDA